MKDIGIVDVIALSIVIVGIISAVYSLIYGYITYREYSHPRPFYKRKGWYKEARIMYKDIIQNDFEFRKDFKKLTELQKSL